MKRILNIAGGLLGLLVLTGMVVLLSTILRSQQGEPVSLQSTLGAVTPTPTWDRLFESPIETPTRPPSPTIPPTVTRPPKPSPSPTPIPTATPIPTPLPLPPSAFYALWAENYPEGEGSVLWLADPCDIGSRKEVLRFERDRIAEAALSPDGRKLALVTTYWKTSTLWVANVDGTDLRQLEQGPGISGPLFWSRDGCSLTYGVSWREEATAVPTVPGRTGTPIPALVWRGAIELVNVTTEEKLRLLEIEPDTSLSVLGWSANGRAIYYSRSIFQEPDKQEYELWAVDQSGRQAHKIASIGREPVPLILSPDGSKFLIETSEGWAWISAEGQTRQDIPLPSWKQRCGLIWSLKGNEVIFCQVDEQQPIEHIKTYNLHTKVIQVLSSFKIPPNSIPLTPLAVSPDMQWMTALAYGVQHWVHLPTGMIVTVPTPEKGSVLHEAWIPREARK